MTAPPSRGTDPRVGAVVQAGILTLAGSEDAKAAIELLETAGLIVVYPDDATVERVADVILREGGGPGNSIHSWRCEYCVTGVARAVLAALAQPPAPTRHSYHGVTGQEPCALCAHLAAGGPDGE